MTTNQATWDKIYRSLRKERDDKLRWQLFDVNVRELTNYIDELYDKIAELEYRLNKAEEYQQEQND